jgi:uncharacterized protein (TIGR02646 family)
MRKVEKDLTQKPTSLSRPDLLDLLIAIGQNKDLIDSDIYRGKIKSKEGIKEEVVEALEAIYHKKCAYCEDFATPEVEHYRPKKQVIGEPQHGGYSWLCYEWSNLVVSCHECNKIGGGKGNYFPVRNRRTQLTDCYTDQVLDFKKCAAHQAPLINEGPYLLHPEIDDPSEYLSFEIDEKKRGIALKGLDGVNERGDETIRICNLNREELLRKRQEAVIFPILKHIKLAFSLLSKQTISKPQFVELIYAIFKELDNEKNNYEHSFTLLRKIVIESLESFNSLITNQLPKDQQQIIQPFFETYFNSQSLQNN